MHKKTPQEEYAERTEELFNRYFHGQTPCPTLLYHYTNASGLLGITSSGKLYLTHAGYLNDPGELRYAAAMILDTIDGIHAQRGNVLDEFCAFVRNELDLERRNFPAYICCFCEDPDLLSQWRGYGGAADGYSIGFDLTVVAARPNPNSGQFPVLRKVEYDKDVQKKFVSDWTTAIADLVEHSGKTQTANEVSLYRQTIGECLVAFKSPVYAEEKEWRLVQFSEAPSGLDFAVSRSVLKPRTSFSLESGRLPIYQVVLGPVLDHNLAAKSVRMMLNRYGYLGVAVDPSDIKYRGSV